MIEPIMFVGIGFLVAGLLVHRLSFRWCMRAPCA